MSRSHCDSDSGSRKLNSPVWRGCTVESPLELNPAVERTVAIAGPLTNFMLFGVGYVVFTYLDWNLVWIRFFMQANAASGCLICCPLFRSTEEEFYGHPLQKGLVLAANRVRRKVGERFVFGVDDHWKLWACDRFVQRIAHGDEHLYFRCGKEEQANAFFVLFRHITRKKARSTSSNDLAGRAACGY